MKTLAMIVTVLSTIASASTFAAAADQEAPPPAALAPTSGDPDLDEPYPRRAHLTFKLHAGPLFDSIASSWLYGAKGAFGIGADTKYLGVFGVLSGGGGKTDGGLDFYELSAGPDLEWPLVPVRLGVRPRFGWLGIRRATNGEVESDMRAGIGGLLQVDFMREGGWVVGLEVEPRIDAAFGFDVFGETPTYPVFGVRGGLTVRARVPRRPDPRDQPAPRIGAR